MNIVKVISTKLQESKRFIKFVNMGKDDIQECNTIQPHGIDSNPVKDMVALYAKTSEVGKPVIVGYVNENQVAEIGGSRLYSTDSDGVEQIAIYMRADGTAEIGGDADFLAGFNDLKAGFDELVGDVRTLTTAHNLHMHPTAATGPPSPPTVTVPVATTASIDAAKIASLKCP